MSKKRYHKYFVNQRYKQKLENKIYIKFLTKVADPRYEREHPYRFWYFEKGISFNNPKDGKDTYVYYKRPEVPYTILKVHTSPRYSKRRKYYCKQSAKRVRQQAKHFQELYQYGRYKKIYDIPLNLD